MKNTGIFSNCIVMLILVLSLSVHADAVELGEYEIKAGMLYNFINYIEWPDDSFDKARTVGVCIAGDNSSNRIFYRLNGKPFKDYTIVVRQIRETAGAAGCNLLFIHGSEKHQLSAYLHMAQKKSILTVSDLDNFASLGGIIGFIEQDGKVRFEINTDASQRSRIKLNSQLLKLARIVKDRN